MRQQVPQVTSPTSTQYSAEAAQPTSSNGSLFSVPEAPREGDVSFSRGSSVHNGRGPPSAQAPMSSARERLRIELPHTPEETVFGALHMVDDDAPPAPQTTTMPRSPLSRATSEFIVDPNTAAIFQEFRAQQSTMALLNADLTTKSLLDASKFKSTASPSKKAHDVTRKRGSTMSVFRRGPRSSITTTVASPIALEVSARHRVSLGEDDPLSPDADPLASSIEPANVSVHSTHAAVVHAEGISSSTSNDDGGVNGGDKSDDDVSGRDQLGMEKVLENAAAVHGLRLTWILYAMICIVIVLFIMLFIQITYMTNATFRRTGREAVQTKLSSVSNNAEMLMSELRFFFEIAFSAMITAEGAVALNVSSTLSHNVCSRIFGAPIAVTLYDGDGAFLSRINCPGEVVMPIYENIPAAYVVSQDGPRMVLYSEDIITAYRSVAIGGDPNHLSTISVQMKRQTLGQFMLSNAVAKYSSATMQDVYTTVLLPFSARSDLSGNLTVALLTLDANTPNYTVSLDSPAVTTPLERYNAICASSSKNTWVKVLRPLRLDLASNVADPDVNDDGVVQGTTLDVPNPFMEYNGAWGLLSETVQCGVFCTHADATRCDADNPTNIYMMARYTVRANEWTSVTIVASVSIAAVILFSMLLVIAYFSISTPVHFLRFQIMRIIGVGRTRTRLQKAVDRATHRIWIGDMTALVRAVHVLGICFQVNKKYVPLHVLRAIAEELSRQRLDVFADYEVDNADSDDVDSGIAAAPLELLSGEARNDIIPLSSAPPAVIRIDVMDREERYEDRAAQRAGMGNSIDGTCDDDKRSSVEMLAFAPLADTSPKELEGFAAAHVTTIPSPSGPTALGTNERFFSDQSGVFGESMDAGVGLDLGASGAFSATFMRTIAQPQTRHMLMNINRDDGATILAVRIDGIDSAYLFNYNVTARNHHVIMAFLLRCIRQHRGSIFYRTGACLGAVWNAFDSCSDHVARAAACACDMALAFAEHRKKGLQVGIVLHQGNFVYGNVDDSKEAFATAFGEAPEQAITLADYAATQAMLNIVVTEPVKQSLSTLYEFAVVDVIKLIGNSNFLILFDLCGRRDRSSAMAPSTPGSPAHSTFALEYAKAFSLFRSNRFDEAVIALEAMGTMGSVNERRLVFRLEQLSRHFARYPRTITQPYYRPFPHWANYELLALADASVASSQRRLAPTSTDDLDTPIKPSPPSASPYVLPLPTIDDPEAKLEVVDGALAFKRDLHDRVRRLGASATAIANTSGSVTAASCTTVPSSVALGPQKTLTPMTPLTPLSQLRTLKDMGWPAPVALTGAMPDESNESRSPLSPEEGSTATHGPGSGTSVFQSDDPWVDAPPLLMGTQRGTEEEESSIVTPLGGASSTTQPPTLQGLAPPTSTAHSPGASSSLASVEVEARRATSLATALSGSMWRGDGSEEKPPDPATDHSDSALVAQQSLIQSTSFTLDGTMHARPQNNDADLPPEIEAKNGNTYLRSGRLLGRGSFGSVYMGVDVNSGKLVAVKYLPLRQDESELAGIEAEVMIMQRVKDSHVVEFISYAFQKDNIVLIMECMMAGSLQNMITAFHTLPSSTARVFIRDVLRGLNKLHSMGVVHRDVKPQNVLLTLSGSCKISDFGASASIQELARKDFEEGKVFGTPVYLAPEAAQGKPVKKSDIWSCGIMFLQLLTGKLPYPADKLCLDAPLLVYQIGSFIARPVIAANLDEMDALFARECLREEAANRPSAAQLLQLPLFAL